MEKENEKSEEKEVIVNKEQENIGEEIENNEVSEEVVKEKTKNENTEEIEENKCDEKEEVENKEEPIEKVKQIKEEKISETIEKKSKKSKKIFILIAVFIIFLLFISTIFAIININNNKIIKGVHIEEINISDLSAEEVKKLVNEKITNIEDVELYYGDYNEVVKLEDIGFKVTAIEAINKAISIGKSNNIIIDNFNILRANLFKTKLELDISINEEKFKEMIKNIQAEIPEAIKEYSYEIKEDELIITSGKAGKAINKEELEEKIIENIKKQFNGINESMDIPVSNADPEEINIEKIYKDIYKEAKDAYIVENEDGEIVKLYKEENGIDFEITIEEAKQILLEEKEIYTIPLKITKPKIAVKDLGDKLFKQTLAKYTTIYDAGNINRSHNIALAAKTINGTILLPGETFSYNGILGNTNKEKGYKQASAYAGGKVVQSYGGGICQVSSTLYNAVLYANLEIVERYNHSYAVTYVPAGRDATVAYGGKDFKFKNSRTYPIKISASAKNGVVSISIKGIEEETEYEVELTSTVLSTKQNSTVYENNSSLAEGTEKVIQKGYVGKTSIAYKILKLNGKTISKTVLSKDTYKPMNRIVQVGTKKVTNVQNATTTTNTQQIQTTTNTTTQPNVTATTNVNNTNI